MLRVLKQYYPVRNIFFVIGEGLIIYASVIFAGWILLGVKPFIIVKSLLITLICQICLYYNDLYDLNVTYSSGELGIRLLQALGVATIFLSGIYFVFPKAIISGSFFFALTIGFIILFSMVWRLTWSLVLNKDMLNQKIMVVGSGELARNIMNEIKNRKSCGYVVAAAALESYDDADFADEKNMAVFCREHHAGLCNIAKDMKIKKVVVALRERRAGFPTKELLDCRVSGIDILEGDSFYEKLTGKLSVEHINPEWLIFSEGFRTSLFSRFLKRSLDIVLSFTMLVLLSPVILLTAVLIKIDSKGPVFFPRKEWGKRRKYTKYINSVQWLRMLKSKADPYGQRRMMTVSLLWEDLFVNGVLMNSPSSGMS